MNSIKDLFPIFKNIPELIFLDNAATTQKPILVLDKLMEVYTQYNSNVHRGLYPIAVRADEEYDKAREKIARFINAEKDEIVFTSGTTDATNLIAQSLLNSEIVSKNANVLTTELEHHANFLPWQRVSGNNLEFATFKENQLNFDENKKFDIVAYSIISNVTGRFTDVKDLRKEGLKDAIFIADAAQAIAHMPINVKEMDIDFLVFSGHKMFGPTGIGIMYAKRTFLEKMQPFKVGGGMVDKVSRESTSWAKSPEKFEAGTPPIAEAIALGSAVDFINEMGFNKISQIENELKAYALQELSGLEKIKIYHSENIHSGAVISFTLEGIHPHDIAQFLGDKNICVRAGHHCTQILHREVFEIPASVRVSMSIYNSKEEIDSLISALKECIEFYRV